MRNHKQVLSFFLFLSIVFFLSCSKENSVKVIKTSFEDVIELNTPIKFAFSKDLVPDSLLNRALTEKYFKISPEVEGKTMWITKDELVFIPDKGFSPATSYKITLTNQIVKHKKKYQLSGEKEFTFQTPNLELVDYKIFWTFQDEKSNEKVVHLNLIFNTNVDPSDLGSNLEIKTEGKTVSFKAVSLSPTNDLVFMVDGIKPGDDDYKVEGKIKKGLMPVGGNIAVEDDIKFSTVLTSPYKLSVISVTSEHDGIKGQITVYTSQPVDAENVRKYVTIEPSVKFEVEVYDNYFILSGQEFDVSEKYTVKISKDFTGKVGGILKNDYEHDISFGKLKPSLRFYNSKAGYLSAKGSRGIEVAIVSIPAVKIKITKIYENNIINFLQSGSYNKLSAGDSDYDDDYYYEDYYYNRSTDNLGDVVFEKSIQTNELQKIGNARILKWDFEDKLKEYKGIYQVEISSENSDRYLNIKRIISVSDIGLILKKGKGNISVFANSIINATPLSNVSVSLIGQNNQVITKITTNSDGYAAYEYNDLPASGFEPYLITATLNDDYNYINLGSSYIENSGFEVGGKYKNPSGIEAFIYGERELYRPGEQINISAIVRNYNWESPGQVPVIVKIQTPNGKTLKTMRKTLDENGSFDLSVPTLQSSLTGTYTVELYTSNNVLIGTKSIKVEEFVPDRIKVDVTLNKEELKPGENLSVDIKADNFFGPPAANRNYQVEYSTARKGFYSKKNSGYNFNIENTDTYFERIFRENKTNSDGKAAEIFPVPSTYKDMGLLQSDLYITVFDETGRPVNRKKTVDIYTQDVFYGIQYTGYYASTGVVVNVPLIAVDKDGKALENAKAEVTLIRVEYKTVLSKSGDYYRYRSEEVKKILEIKKLTLNGTSVSYSFVPEINGEYLVRVSRPGAHSYVEQTFWAYGSWGSTNYSSFEVNTEGKIDIELDKEKYISGEKAKVLLRAPFSGKVLVTIENDKVIKYFYTETDKRVSSFEIDIPENYVPNVYITATLFKPHEKSDLPLTVAHGFQSVLVENPTNKVPVSIEAKESSRSNTKQKIVVKSTPNTALTLAIVDNGILQVTNYQTPDPYGFFYAKRALGVSSYDIYPYLFPEIGPSVSQPGGGDMNLEKRVNPLTNKRIKLVSYWSGIIQTNGSGIAEYEINIPQFSGELKIMAVAYKNKAFSSADHFMKVADPLVISTALPRFLSPKDSVLVPVIITNTTAKATNCKAIITVSGPLQIVGEKSQNFKIDANNEKEVLFKVYAQPSIGEGKIDIEVEAMNEKFMNSTDITIRPASPLIKKSGSGVLEAGKTTRLPFDIKEFIPSSVDKKLTVSISPLVQFNRNLDYLVSYPYGCIEQTVSKAFPQIYYNDLVKDILKDEKGGDKNPAYNVQFAIERLKAMQLYSGAMTFWPGGGSETWWGSVYACHFLIEAQKAGYEVEEKMLNLLYSYLRMRLKKKEYITYYYNYNQKKEIVSKEVAYSLYVLALAGKPDISSMNYYKSNLVELSLDSKYLLAAAYALAGDKVKYKSIVPVSFEGEIANTSFGGSFYSYLRDEAIALNALLDVDPDNPQIGILAKHVSESLKNNRYLNTQESVFGFLAMGKIAKIAAASDVTASILSGGKVIGTMKNNTITFNTHQLGKNEITVESQGKGQFYFFWEAEGISADGSYNEVDNFIRVRKTFYNRYGSQITNVVEQNDLILVELAISSLTNKYIENVAMTDILPAGFEIENPRLTELPSEMSYPRDRNRAYPEYLDVRDDRINMFVTVTPETRYYYYLVRAVSPGVFQMGPAGADAMYNGEYHSYNGAGVVKINKK